ncbi:nitroreductase [Priestia flexa]|uniref:nitroreductase family protein n=1 Tax=Priestia flexa TaxID=86664 RepID=UPI003D2D1C81
MSASIRDVIRERRTIRTFNNDPIEKEAIIQLLDDASWAPNHKLRQPWRLVMFYGKGNESLSEQMKNLSKQVSDEGAAKKIGKMAEKFSQSQANIIITVPKDENEMKQEEDFSAVSAFIQNFLLLAWEQEIGVLWKTGKLIHQPGFRKIAGIKEDEAIVGVLMLGKFDDVPASKPREAIIEKLTLIEA